ncbi:hypothetical protein AB3S75_033257 [Citrus x aurantiifolia]
MVGRKKVSLFKEIKLRILSKISGWQSKFFSSGGREVLIKAVAQAVPAYAMSVFRLPSTLCDDIQRAVAGFWWRAKKDRKSIHWTKWESLCHAKGRGGLGFRDFACFNQALIAKQSWRIIQNPESLLTKILQAIYFKSCEFLQAKLRSKPSFIWRSILWGRQIIQKGMRWRIGSGDSVQVYKSQWIPRPQNFKPIAPATLSEDANVACLIDANHQWKETLIHQHFSKEDAEKILQIQLPNSPQPDQILWHYDKKGQYSVKSGYQIARKIKHSDESSCSENSSGQWNVIWAMELPEKIKIFTWRAVKNLLPTAENLWKRRVVHDPICSRCKMKAGSIVHAILECKPARQIWKLTPYYAEMNVLINQDLLSMMKEMEKRRSKEELRRIIALCWAAWYSRNGSIFENIEQDPHITVAKADAIVEAYARVKMGKILAAASNKPEKSLSWLPPLQGFF